MVNNSTIRYDTIVTFPNDGQNMLCNFCLHIYEHNTAYNQYADCCHHKQTTLELC